MAKKPGGYKEEEHCEDCPFVDQPVVHPVLLKDSDYLFIGGAPGEQEVRHDEPFFDGERDDGDGYNEGAILHEYIGPLIAEYRVSLTYAVKCRPPKDKKPCKKEYSPCIPFLEREIAYTNPKLIVVLGRVALKVLTGLQAGVKDLNGKILTEYPRPVLVCIKPTAVKHDKSIGQFEKGILPAIRYFEETQDYKRIDGEYPKEGGRYAFDLETTGFKPSGRDVSIKQRKVTVKEHDGAIRCIGVSDGKKAYYVGE